MYINNDNLWKLSLSHVLTLKSILKLSINQPKTFELSIMNQTNALTSWASGANLWGPEKEDQFGKPTHYDGMLEVVGLTGVVHMGQIQSGLRSAIRIAQGGHVSLRPQLHYT